MPEEPPPEIAELLGCGGKIEVADIGAAAIAETPPYKKLIDLGLARLNAFDADVRQHDELRRIYGGDLALFTQILGDGSEQILHLASPASGMTSLLQPSSPGLAFFNGFTAFGEIHGSERVATTRLDAVEHLPNLDYLKMDIQGAELQVLQHGVERLRDCCMIQLEVSFVPLYENQPSFGEVDVWMRDQGYIPHCFTDVKRWSISPVRRRNSDRAPFNQLLEADIVYMKDFARVESWDDEILRRTALIAHYCYDSFDLVGHLIAKLQDRGSLPPGSLHRYLELLNKSRQPQAQ
ncbi:MAG: FkbM family methyltransferase [Phenylobacterium sp.]|uniref:FkbM family methyltransferase n=1 Tax=Phenylobacterium sp. TaxID=1871053 RepID=UPI00272FFA25|nr:FkbM family methyltransferase [Phenylobacterium sp.]MDP2009418.1 FkbM family methyltransferase [Phenylobacterium sp.]